MRRLLLVVALLFTPMEVFSQEAPPPASASDLDSNKDGKVDATEAAAATGGDASVSEVLEDATGVYDAVKNKNSLPKGTFWAILLGTIFKLLLSGIKVLGNNVAWFKSKDGKRVLKYSTIGLGAAAAIAANFGLGWDWMDAAQLLLSGPLAVAIHEYTKDSKDTPAA